MRLDDRRHAQRQGEVPTAVLAGFRKLQAYSVATLHHFWALPKRSRVSLALMIVGIGLLGYVISQYWSMHREQQRLEAQWDQQQHVAVTAGAAAPSSAQPVIDPKLTRMQIPKINFEAMVVEGDSRKQLLLGPGHIVHTPLPGEPGNAVITGHRDTFFRHIFELGKGDEILVQRNGQTFRYAVTGKKIVKPEDVSVLRPTNDSELTLITCYPTYYIGPAPERLVVFSKLLPKDGSGTDPRPATD